MMNALVEILHNLKSKLYEAYKNRTEIIVSLENGFITCNHTIKLDVLNIQQKDYDTNIYIVDNWLEVNLNISKNVNIEYDNEGTFLISDNNLKMQLTFV